MTARKTKRKTASVRALPANVSNSETTEAVIGRAREHILYAAALLKSVNGETQRVAWMLEDTISYLDMPEPESDEDLESLPHHLKVG